MEELERAAFEVQEYENYIKVLCSIHKDCGKVWDWKQIENTSPPKEPTKHDTYEREAQGKLECFKPSLLDKLFRRIETKRDILSRAVREGKDRDDRLYREAHKKYEQQYETWKQTCELANKVQSGDAEAYIEAIRQVDPFSELSELGSSFEFKTGTSNLVKVTLYVRSDEVVPREVKTLLKSGKLSIKKMTKSKFNELYQDYVCGCILRIARELFALLPIDMTIITAVGELLNTKTGYIEKQPILSVAVPKDTLSRLNFEMIDPSDSMDNFVQHMHFNKTKGFSAVEKIEPSNLQ